MNKLLAAPVMGAILLVSACSSIATTGGATADASPATTSTASASSTGSVTASGLTYPIVDTSQTSCFSSAGLEITCPVAGEADYGQDAQTDGYAASYTDNGDGTVTDNVTGLVWTQNADTNGDGTFDTTDKLSMDASAAYCENLSLGGSDDWTLPSIKQLYSLMNFTGTDPSGYEEDDTSGLVPFIDTAYFDFDYGDTSSQERIIDSQYATTTAFVDESNPLLFGVNFADGRIKGYGLSLHGQDKTFTVACIEANTTYGVNDFADNGDSTITDAATGLTWAQDDSGTTDPEGMNWAEALAYVEQANAGEYLGYSDWRLPNVKELQSIVDYTRSPETTGTAAIDPLFNTTEITDENGNVDFGFYWSGTTHVNWTDTPGSAASYVAFGEALGYSSDTGWTDVHGAGAQRSDPKQGDAADWPTGNGPQGDAIRIDNMVRLVRG